MSVSVPVSRTSPNYLRYCVCVCVFVSIGATMLMASRLAIWSKIIKTVAKWLPVAAAAAQPRLGATEIVSHTHTHTRYLQIRCLAE